MPMTKHPVLSVCLALCLSCAGSARLQAQKIGPGKQVVIDENRPFVYIKFDHIGPGEQRSEDEPSSRIWLHLKNNCRIPIQVIANGVPDGSPRDEVGIQHEVVPNPPIRGLVTYSFPVTPKPLGVANPEQHTSTAEVEEMPRGYVIDVGSLVTIMPGKDILFSIPINHLSERWHVEIRLEFDLPKGKGSRNPKVSLGPSMVIEYSMEDLPPEFRATVEKR